MAEMYAKTVWYRTTVTTKGEVIVPADQPAGPKGAYRKITLLIREAPEIEIALDADPSSGDAPDSYWPNPPLNKTLCFHLQPGQSVVARAVTGLHELSVICEYWKP